MLGGGTILETSPAEIEAAEAGLTRVCQIASWAYICGK